MNDDKLKLYDEVFTNQIIRAGKWTLLISIPLSFLPAIYIWSRYDAIPPLRNILTGWFLIVSIYGAWYIVEPISYFPILGTAGTYMSFLSGNIANMRVPCAAVAQDVLEVEPGSKEAELVATLGIAGSIVTNLIIVTIAALAGNKLISYLPPIVVQAFNFVLPAIFGALFVMFSIKYPKYGVFAIALGVLTLGVIKVIPTWSVIPICVFGTIAFAVNSYKKEQTNTRG